MQAILAKPEPGTKQCKIQMVKRDGTEVLRGTASVGDKGPATALDQRLTELKPLADPVILRDVKVGMKTGRQTVRMGFDQNMGELYPFSLNDKLKVITEPSSYYRREEESAIPGDDRSFRSRCSACCFNIDRGTISCRSRARRSACSPIRKSA